MTKPAWVALFLTVGLALPSLLPSTARAEDGDGTMSQIQSALEKLAKLKVSGYVQARYDVSETSSDSAAVSSSSIKSANLDRFYIRRARFKVKYDASPTSSGVVYVDGGSDREAKILEAYVTLTEPWTGEKRHTLSVGLMNVPFGYEVEQSSSHRELPERSRAENVLFAGERDRGATLTSRWRPELETTVGVFNGGGIKDPNFPNDDPTRGKDWLVRGRYEQNDIRLGATWYQGKALVPLTGPDPEVDRTRLGLEGGIGFTAGNAGATEVRGEFYAGTNPNADSLKALTTASAGGGRVLATGADAGHLATDFRGGYVMVVQNLGRQWQVAGRYDVYDPNTDLDHDQYARVGLGIHYFWDTHTRITLAYDVPNTDVPAGGGFQDPADNLWTLQFQHKF